jgi:hypothetical protein
MHAVLIMQTPGGQNEFIDCQNAKFHITELSIMDVKSGWNPTLELLKHTYRLWELTPLGLQNLKFSNYQPLCTTQDE